MLISTIGSISALIILVFLFLQFIYRMNKQQRALPFFPTALFILLCFSTCVVIDGILLNENLENIPWLLALQLTFSGIGILVMYLFQENLIQTQKSDFRFIVVFGLVLLHIIFQWIIFYLETVSDPNTDIFFSLSAFSYHSVGIFVFGFFGLPIWLKTYHISKSKMFLPYIGAYLFIIVGQFLLLIVEFNRISISTLSPTLELIESIGTFFAFIGMFVLYCLISIAFHVVYRLPQENYGLMVSDPHGIVLYFIRFKTSHPIELQEDLLSGFLSAVHAMFDESLKAKKKVNLISSGDAEILMEHGKHVSIIFLAQKISGLVAGELRHFIKEFERIFAQELKTKQMNLAVYKKTQELVERRFPYFEIEPMSDSRT